MRRFLSIALLVAGCRKESPPAPPPPPAAQEERDASLDRARAAARKLGMTLRRRLVEAMKQGGPRGAVEVCANEAQALTRRIAAETGAEVGRASLRLRNPASAPPAWVAAWLSRQGERAAAGVEGLARVDETPGGPRARVILPIATEGLCTACHGEPGAISADVREALKHRYPRDRATGYRVGDLRGALWAEAPAGR
jgi:hypothetical protein